jgi:hypothetical protein
MLTCGALWSMALRPVPGPLVRWCRPPGTEPRTRLPCVRRTVKAAPRSRRCPKPCLARSPGPKPPLPIPLPTGPVSEHATPTAMSEHRADAAVACLRHTTGAARPRFTASAPISTVAPVLLRGWPPCLTSLRLLHTDLTDGPPLSTTSLAIVAAAESLLR